MRRWILPLLARSGSYELSTDFELVVSREDAEQVLEGYLRQGEDWYPIENGVPCFLRGAARPDQHDFAERHDLPAPKNQATSPASLDQKFTARTFSFKWTQFQRYGDTPEERKFLFGWYRRKFGLNEDADLSTFYAGRELVLEVGPGSGFNTKYIAEHCKGRVIAADISAAADVVFSKTSDLPNCSVVRADLMDLPFRDDLFDLIVADGVLHHTPNTKAAVAELYRKLRRGGQFFFYVYKKMGAARQFSDQHIREQFSKLSPEACLDACRTLTEMGRELSRLGATVTLTRPIDVLGIPAGTHDIQRLIYYNFVKCFWNDAFDFETNNMVNFDWYHPHDAWQHTIDEVEGWLKSMQIQEYAFNDANPNGISVLLRKW
jgi:SAM-dependent methyltransferase